MKLSRNFFLGALLILAMAGTAEMLFGQAPDPAPPEPPASLGPSDDLGSLADQPRVREKLGLTDAQAEQLRALGREAIKNAIRNRADLVVKRIELQELLEADAPDRAQIGKKLKEINDFHYALLKSRVETRLGVAKVLTPDQRRKLRSLVGAHLRERSGRFGWRGFGPRGFGHRPPGAGGFGPREPMPAPPPPKP